MKRSLIANMDFSQKARYCVLSIITIFAAVTFHVTSGNDNCIECSMKISNVIDEMKLTLKSRDPLELDTPEPCKKCTFGGIVTIGLDGEVCSDKCEVDGNVCYDHRIGLKFEHITLTCECELPCNPADIAKMMMDRAKNPQQGLSCVKPGSSPMDPTSYNAADSIPKPNPMGFMKLSQCQPKIPKPGKAQPPPKCVGKAVIKFTNFKFEATLRSCVKNSKVETTKIKLDPSAMKGSKIVCEGKNELFKGSCECLVQTGFLDELLASAVKMLFPCYGDDQMGENADVIKELVCNELVEEK